MPVVRSGRSSSRIRKIANVWSAYEAAPRRSRMRDPWPMERFRRGGLTFDVCDSGPPDGPVVVLLHGFPQLNTVWDAVVPLLTAHGYRCLAPNQRGYSSGARPRRRRDYRMSELVDDVDQLIESGLFRVMTGLVRRERGRDSAAGRNADVVLTATLCAQLRADVHARIFTARTHAANTGGLAKASADIAGTATSDLSADSLCAGAAGRREPAPPVALIVAPPSHQALATRMQAWKRSSGPSLSAQVIVILSTSHR